MIQAAVPAANFHAIVYFHDESLRQVYTKVLLRASRINNVNINSCISIYLCSLWILS